MSSNSTEWWRHAVIYQVYPRSFADSTGNGMGDLPGITTHLPYLRDLGVDAVWVSPFYPSPQNDAGYDVEDYCNVDPIFGTLADADRLIARAHEIGLRIIVDVVPNHTSDQHVWFRQSLASPVGSPERDRYHFLEPDPEHPESAPNNWESNFGGAAWSKHDDDPYGQWYLHLFDSSQPDLNWENPQVRADFDDILRFWLDRGVDGFRVDVAHGLMKAPGFPDATGSTHPDRHLTPFGDATMASSATPYWDQDGVHEIYRRWRRIVDSYGSGDTQRIMVAEAWVEPIDRIARYVRPDEHHQAFNFAFIDTRWDAAALRSVITQSYEVNDAVGAPTTWVLSNHDVIRHATRLALAPEEAVTQLAGPVHEPDRRTGLNRARAASTLMLGLPGSAYLYQGEELGLPEVLDIPDRLRQDPTFYRTRMNSGSSSPELGRDGCRVPLPWLSEAPSYGFSPPLTESAGTHSPASPWLPQPAIFGDLAVDRQTGDPSSTMELYRRLLRLRRTLRIASGKAKVIDPVDGDRSDGWDRSDVLVVEVTTKANPETSTGTSTVLVCTNIGTKHWNIPAGHGVLIASTPGVDDRLPPDCTVWLARLDSAAE